jgi:hypothetical protein
VIEGESDAFRPARKIQRKVSRDEEDDDVQEDDGYSFGCGGDGDEIDVDEIPYDLLIPRDEDGENGPKTITRMDTQRQSGSFLAYLLMSTINKMTEDITKVSGTYCHKPHLNLRIGPTTTSRRW